MTNLKTEIELNQHLKKVLNSHSLEHVKEKLIEINRLTTEVSNFLVKCYKVGQELSSLPFRIGAVQKLTDINSEFTADLLLPFLKTSPGFRKLKRDIFFKLEKEFGRQAIVSEKPIGVSLKFLSGSEWLKIDVIPGKEEKNGNIIFYHQKRYLKISTDFHKQIQAFIGLDNTIARDIIKLFKVWFKTQIDLKLSSFTIELMVWKTLAYFSPPPFPNHWKQLEFTLGYLAANLSKLKLIDPGTGKTARGILLSNSQKKIVAGRFRNVLADLRSADPGIEKHFPRNGRFG